MPQEDLAIAGKKNPPSGGWGRGYSQAVREQALHMLALCHGRSRDAEKALKEAGVDPCPGHATIRHWKLDEPDRYARIEEEELGKVYAQLARQNEAVATKALNLQEDMLDELQAALNDGKLDIQKLSSDMRNAGVTGGIAQEKGALARGRPTEIKAMPDPTQILRAIQAKFPGILQLDSAEVEVEVHDEGGNDDG